jgi:hypothetical protein
MGLLIVVAVLMVAGLLAWRFGADSRDGQDWVSYCVSRGNQFVDRSRRLPNRGTTDPT